MKYFGYCLCFLLFSGLIESCHYLDYDEIQKYQGANVWNDRYRLRDMLVAGYGDLAGNLNQVGGATRASASDDAVESSTFAGVQIMTDGRWSAINDEDNRWSLLFTAIRQMNDFLSKFSPDSLKSTQYDDDYPQIMESFASYPYQARFLRALFYFRLLKRYGHVPLVTKTLTTQEANQVKPSSYEQVTQFIVNECTEVAPNLPVTYETQPFRETGRATRGAALSLKAKALLYAASPLHNPSDDLKKWDSAAQACWDVIDKGWYKLDPDYNNLFNSISSPELIFTLREAASNYYEADNFPIGYQGASNDVGTNPTQNLVSAFEMQKTGLPITDINSGYDPQHPYQGRDPRLAETVIFNNSTWQGRPVQIWNGGKDGPPLTGATPTGYYLKKGVVENVSLEPSHTTTARHTQIIFRYGGILLDFAEAMNEAYGPDNAAGFGMTARQAVNKIRERSAMPDFPAGLTKAQFREMVHHERRVEMAFENQRFWDIRRWKIGPSTIDIKGMKITRSSNGNFTYKVETVAHRVWDDKYYLFPIPQSELFINPDLKQNPGWGD